MPGDAMPAPPTTADPVLAVNGLRRHFGDLAAVDGVSFEVRPGEVVGLLGPNGAGKTTTIDMVLGLLKPSAGTVRIAGLDITHHRAAALASTNFAATYAPLPGNLTVEENLRFFGRLYSVRDLPQRIDALVRLFDLQALRGRRVGVLSSGEQTRALVAKAMLNRPRLLLLDEPTASLDPATARDLRKHIRDACTTDGTGILWTSHNMVEVEAVCDRVLLMSKGRILLEGDPRTLAAQHGQPNLEELFVQVAREGLQPSGRHAPLDGEAGP